MCYSFVGSTDKKSVHWGGREDDLRIVPQSQRPRTGVIVLAIQKWDLHGPYLMFDSFSRLGLLYHTGRLYEPDCLLMVSSLAPPSESYTQK